MADVKAFRGLTYNQAKVGEQGCVVSPPHDVISAEDQDKYYDTSPYNIIRLILGKIQPGDDELANQYSRAKETLEEWLSNEVLVRDSEPAIYAYEQEFMLDNGSVKKQLGFISLVKLEPFEKGVILPHERIITKMKEDRLNLMKSCHANMSLIITAYSDSMLKTNKLLEDKTSGAPDIEVTFGKHPCTHRIWAIHEQEFINNLCGFFDGKKLYIADGHHRYTTALEFHQNHDKSEESAYMSMFMLNMDGDGVTILPAHRILKNIPGFNEEDIKNRLGEYFSFTEYAKEDEKEFFTALENGRRENTFGLYCGNGSYHLMKLKDAKVMDMLEGISEIWKSMDVIILDKLILSKILGVDSNEYAERENLVFKKERKKAVKYVDEKGFELAFFLNPTSMHEVKEAAEAGERMPQKSTYFYPKPLSGLVLHKFD